MSRYVDYVITNYGMIDTETGTTTSSDSERQYNLSRTSSKKQNNRKGSKNRSNKSKKHNKTKKNIHKGGQSSEEETSDLRDRIDELNEPTGGFPNIVVCSGEDTEPEVKDNLSRREISTDKAILSISQILKSRRNI